MYVAFACRAEMYRGGGGIPRDSEYGYSKDFKCPPVGHFQLSAAGGTRGKVATGRRSDDLALLQRKFRVRTAQKKQIFL